MSRAVDPRRVMTRDQYRRVRALAHANGGRADVTAGFPDGRVEVALPPSPHPHRVGLNRRRAPRAFRVVASVATCASLWCVLGGAAGTLPEAGVILGALLGLLEGWPTTRPPRFRPVDWLVAVAVALGVEEFREFGHHGRGGR